MSVKVSSWVWHDKATKGINGNELVVLLALADVANDNGVCTYFDSPDDATQTALAKKARVHRATLVRAIDKLVERGIVEVTPGRQHAPNSYRIVLSQASRRATAKKSQSATSDDSQMSHPVTQMSQSVDSDVAVFDTTPSIDVLNVSTRGGASRGTRIPEPFIVNIPMREWAANETPLVDVDRSTRRFVDYWRAATKNATKKDWIATWRNWLRKDQEEAERRPNVKKSPTERALSVIEMGQRMQAAADADQRGISA